MFFKTEDASGICLAVDAKCENSVILFTKSFTVSSVDNVEVSERSVLYLHSVCVHKMAETRETLLASSAKSNKSNKCECSV